MRLIHRSILSPLCRSTKPIGMTRRIFLAVFFSWMRQATVLAIAKPQPGPSRSGMNLC
jgi:hypothetical protein